MAGSLPLAAYPLTQYISILLRLNISLFDQTLTVSERLSYETDILLQTLTLHRSYSDIGKKIRLFQFLSKLLDFALSEYYSDRLKGTVCVPFVLSIHFWKLMLYHG